MVTLNINSRKTVLYPILQRRGERRATINEVLLFIGFVKVVRSVRCQKKHAREVSGEARDIAK